MGCRGGGACLVCVRAFCFFFALFRASYCSELNFPYYLFTVWSCCLFGLFVLLSSLR